MGAIRTFVGHARSNAIGHIIGEEFLGGKAITVTPFPNLLMEALTKTCLKL